MSRGKHRRRNPGQIPRLRERIRVLEEDQTYWNGRSHDLSSKLVAQSRLIHELLTLLGLPRTGGAPACRDLEVREMDIHRIPGVSQNPSKEAMELIVHTHFQLEIGELGAHVGMELLNSGGISLNTIPDPYSRRMRFRLEYPSQRIRDILDQINSRAYLRKE